VAPPRNREAILKEEILTMKKQLSLLACLILGATAVIAQSADPSVQTKQAEPNTWKTYTIKDEKVSAMLPTHPAMSTTWRYREKSRQTLTDHMVGAYADGVVYGIYTYDNRQPRDSFDDFVARETQRSNWDALTARSVKIGRYAGKEYSSSANYPSITQLFAVEDRFYKFTATGAPADDARVKQFFSSITLERKAGIEVSDGQGILLSEATGPSILTGREVDSKVRLVMKPEPQYTEDARRNQIVGTVVLKVVFASSGTVNNIRTVQGLPHGLTEKAIDAARKIKFIPAVKGGEFVSMWMQLEYNFNLY
jgi:TonB family protein